MSHVYQLIWFRQDLRIHDHAALWHATQTGSCVAIVVLSPEQWQRHDDAPIKIEFYLRQLQELKKQLDSLNIPLISANFGCIQLIRYGCLPRFFGTDCGYGF